MDNVGEFMMIESALRGSPSKGWVFGLREV
jgi:hypothetical protein